MNQFYLGKTKSSSPSSLFFCLFFDTCFCQRQWDNLFYTASESESMDAAYKLNLDTTVYLNFPHDTDIDVKVSI